MDSGCASLALRAPRFANSTESETRLDLLLSLRAEAGLRLVDLSLAGELTPVLRPSRILKNAELTAASKSRLSSFCKSRFNYLNVNNEESQNDISIHTNLMLIINYP